jgi:hypothetical protein
MFLRCKFFLLSISSNRTIKLLHFARVDACHVYWLFAVRLLIKFRVGSDIYVHPCEVVRCHHGMARPQVADRGTASDMEGSCE